MSPSNRNQIEFLKKINLLQHSSSNKSKHLGSLIKDKIYTVCIK
jgi:hypothetical protein